DDAPIFRAQETLQYAYPGTIFSAKFHAADPDVPTRTVEYSFEGDIPEGMLLNTTTGQVTWDVPEDALFDQMSITVRASEILGDGSLGLSSVQTIQLVIGQPWLAAMEQAMQQMQEQKSSSPKIDPTVLAAALSGAAPTSAGTTPRTTSSAKGSLSSGTSDFAADQGFFGLQLGTSTASGSEVKPTETDPNELQPELDASKKRDEKVVPASATEDVSHHTPRSDQNTEAAAAVDSQELYYDMTNEQPTLQSTVQATPEETPEQG
ncbi:MAG: putative Ig domain-containing protein, partial [Planctomycetia bacterium]